MTKRHSGPATYILTAEFMLRNPHDYEFARSQIERAIKELSFLTGVEMQVDYISLEKKLPGVADG